MEAELPSHINVLELQAVKLTLQALAPSHTNVHIKVMVDNTTAATYINKMGGAHSTSCNAITKEIWLWAQARNIWLSAAYVPGSENKIADYKSRHFQDNTEWSICCQLFKKIVKAFFLPDIDLFATRLNCQLHTFVSWKPEPGAWAVDAFTVSWGDLKCYAFPPFSVLGRVLWKVQQDKATGILVVPL